MSTPYTSIERRATPRYVAACDAELLATLSILDVNSDLETEPLVFFGRTIDLSKIGFAVVVPSLHLDDRYCEIDNRLRVSLHVPNGTVSFEVRAVRSQPLNKDDKSEGYLLGMKVLRVLQHETEFQEFLSDLAARRN